ncbi:hypothetical protein Bca52824_040365 [Brassica carinata]|uniref:Uncharacterized protein n=1 Tax=Brassica carinata TaxID=52824 RepID=A0A8X7RSY9_BRACI|nr:hypothetical protein Bca52824_040365 [Brassica carinata]
MSNYNVGQIGQQVHSGAPARGKSHHIHDPMKEAQRLFMSWLLPTLKYEPIKAVEPVRGPNTSHGHEALPHHAGPLVNIERDRGLEEMTAARVLVGSRIIVQSHFSHRKKFSDPCCFRISAGGEIGAAQLLRGGKEHITQTDLAEAIGASLLQSIGGGYTSVDMFIKTYDREIKAGACLRITKRRDWNSAQLQWNEHA